MGDYAFSCWCEKVLEQVRFAPDRAAIARELRAHYEDHVQGLLDCGYETELAQERSLEAMGNAEEIGKALDRAHKPWLGWLWQGSRVLVLVFLLLSLWGLIWGENGGENLSWRTKNQLSWQEPPAQALCREVPNGKVWLEVGEPQRMETGEVQVELGISLRLDDPTIPLTLRPEAMHWMEVWDQSGQIPWQTWEMEEQEFQPESNYRQGGNETEERKFVNDSWNGWYFPQVLVLDHWPEWIELRYPYGEGGGWSIRKEVGPWA